MRVAYIRAAEGSIWKHMLAIRVRLGTYRAQSCSWNWVPNWCTHYRVLQLLLMWLAHTRICHCMWQDATSNNKLDTKACALQSDWQVVKNGFCDLGDVLLTSNINPQDARLQYILWHVPWCLSLQTKLTKAKDGKLDLKWCSGRYYILHLDSSF